MQVRLRLPSLLVREYARYKGQYIPPKLQAKQSMDQLQQRMSVFAPCPRGTAIELHWPGPLADQLDDGVYDSR